MAQNIIFTIIFSFLFTYISYKLIKPFLFKFFLVQPSYRSAHKKPVPSGGGIPIVLTLCIGMTLFGNFVPLLSLPLALIGFIDDLRNVDIKFRLFVQFTTGILILKESLFLQRNDFQYGLLVTFFIYLIFAFLITAIINFSNFVDGIDGLLTSNLIVIFSFAAIKVNPSLWTIVSCLLSFLLFNWHPSKLFMGDVGSTFLGALFAGILLNCDSWQESLRLLLIAMPLLSDAFICVIRRFFAKQNILQPHSLHLFQRLFQAGWSQSKITTYYTVATFIMAIFSLFNSFILSLIVLLFIYSFAIYLDKKVAVPFLVSLKNSFSLK